MFKAFSRDKWSLGSFGHMLAITEIGDDLL
jgi:hypothetical protein